MNVTIYVNWYTQEIYTEAELEKKRNTLAKENLQDYEIFNEWLEESSVFSSLADAFIDNSIDQMKQLRKQYVDFVKNTVVCNLLNEELEQIELNI